MGNFDTLCRELFSRKELFCDLFNYKLHGGRKVILPEHLQDSCPYEIDSQAYHPGGRVIYGERDIINRYVVRRPTGKTAFVLMALENQRNTDYAMPVRVDYYRSLRLMRQVKALHEKHMKIPKERNRLKTSLLLPEDRLEGIVTLVLYLNPEPWKGPRDLHSLLSDGSTPYLNYIPNHELNIIEPYAMQEGDFRKLPGDLSFLLNATKLSNNKEKLSEYLCQPKGRRQIHFFSLPLFEAVTGMKVDGNDKGINIKEKLEKNKEETIEMRKLWDPTKYFRKIALEEAKQKGQKKGIKIGEQKGIEIGERTGLIRGRIEAFREMGVTDQDICSKLMTVFNFTKKEALQRIAECPPPLPN